MKKTLLLLTVLWSLTRVNPLAASPLYGGYNGQSLFWIDTFFFGVDNQAQWWVRLPVDLVQGSLRIIFKFESNGALSTEFAMYNVPGQGDLIFGFDNTGLSWTETFGPDFLAGSSSDGVSWSESNIFEYVGMGSDNNNSVWWFVAFNYQNKFPVTAGINISLFIPPPPPEDIDIQPLDQQMFLSGLFLRNLEGVKNIVGFLRELSRDRELLNKTQLLTSQPFDSTSLIRFAKENVFPEERIEKIRGMVEKFVSADSHF